MTHVNDLSNEQLEALAILAEECGEVIQIVGKILRHGLDSNWHDDPTNRELLEQEIGDMLLAAGIVTIKMLNEQSIKDRMDSKPEKLRKFLHYLNLDEVIYEDS